MRWELQEAGWWWLVDDLVDDGSPIATDCKEYDARWHTYIHRDVPPGNSVHRSLKKGKE